jgi:tetratricopeptide (TPR) repeat protein
MTRGLLLSAIALLIAASGAVSAAEPPELFLRAYQEYQAGERDERDGRPREAFDRYQAAVGILAEIQASDPTWQQLVVEFRMRKAKEAVGRLQAEFQEGPTVPAVQPKEELLPARGFEIDIPEPMVSVAPPPQPAPLVQTPLEERELLPAVVSPPLPPESPDPQAAFGELAGAKVKIADLEGELARLRGELAGARMEVEKNKTEMVAARGELAKAQRELEAAKSDRDRFKAQAEATGPAGIGKLSSRIAELEADNEALLAENARISGKLRRASDFIKGTLKTLEAVEDDRRAVAGQRDKAEERAKRLKDNEAELAKLKAEREQMAANFEKEKKVLEKEKAEEVAKADADRGKAEGELAKAKEGFEKQLAEKQARIDELEGVRANNQELAARLEEAEKQINDAEKNKVDRGELAKLQVEIDSLQKRLGESRNELTARDDNIRSLVAQLDEATGEVARLKLNPKPTEDSRRMVEENELLRSIVLRQIKEQNERTEAAAVLQQELDKLLVKSDTLSAQLAVLGRPPVQLSEKEILIFREPAVILDDPDTGPTQASYTATDGGAELLGGLPPAPEGIEALGPESRKLVDEARDMMKLRRFTDAERIYGRIVDSAPDNHFALSNLAVTQIQSGKLSAAQVALEKALKLKPGDVFASVNLANVLCRQARYADAVELLKEVLKNDPQNAVAHNYMAIALGRQGNTAEAEEFFQRSILLDGRYPNAHFNLAVMYAASEPPALELAKKHYERAKELGAEPDSTLEQRLENVRAAN